MIAWEALATTIMLKFDFTSFRSPLNSIEECAWVVRVAQCVQNAIDIYETHISNTSEADQYQKVYESVKRHSEHLATYGDISK
jgi:hypothetical protein